MNVIHKHRIPPMGFTTHVHSL